MKISSIKASIVCFGLLLINNFAVAAYVYNAAGDEVTDTVTGLTWRRCSEGQTWSGTTCTGNANTYTYEQALQRAAGQATSTGKAWRVPNLQELTNIASRTRENPAIDTVAFPATPSYVYWTSSSNVGDGYLVMSVSFDRYLAGVTARTGPFHVRLVR